MTTIKNKPKLIAITGGPCSGKSTLIEQLKADRFYNEKTLFVPEAATMVLPGFLAVRDSVEHHRDSFWQYSLQLTITRLQYELEETYKDAAVKLGKSTIICDRGIRDAEVYTDQANEVYASIGHTAVSALTRYDAVIHLESLAVNHPELYETDSNPTRYETNIPEALVVEQRTRQAWEGHPGYAFIPGDTSLETKISDASRVIMQLIDA